MFEAIYRRGHRIVATAFIPNPDNLPVINHIDHVKDNNKVTNLEWSTVAHNTIQGYRHNSHKRGGRGLSDLSYAQLREAVELYKSGYTYEQLNSKYSIEVPTPWGDVLRGRRYREVTGIKGDIRRGDAHPSTKLKEEGVWDILDQYHNKKVSQTPICEQYDLSPAQVSRIVNGNRRVEIYNKFMEVNL